MPRRTLSFVFVLGLTLVCLADRQRTSTAAPEPKPPTVAARTAKVDFRRDIKPILAAHCFKCHGPEKREGGLRFTNQADLLHLNDSGEPAAVPGKSQQSELLRRVLSNDDDERMPPPDAGKPLSTKDVALLRVWIDQGADWPESETIRVQHWAYANPVRSKLPKLNGKNSARSAIDAFVLARLESEGLKSSPPADRARLLRRVSLDLIGLPPSVAEVDAFVNDSRPDAYERVVDRLLKSPRYGERWARQWLDLARYADSNGYQADQFRTMWVYRDWVINAFNQDMPFDQFSIEQIAGDLLPGATVDQKIATGFHRCPTCNVEAGVDPEENRVNQLIDRVNTTGTVWLGTSLECAQCHNHKYDPFTQQDYYQLFAYFNNTPLEVKQVGGRGVTYDFYGPKMELPLPEEQARRRDELQTRQKELQKQVAERETQLTDSQADWERDLAAIPKDEPQQSVVPDNIAKLLARPSDKRNKKQQTELRNHYLSLDPELKQLRAEAAKVKKQSDAIKPVTTLVMIEAEKSRMNNIFKRGNFLDKGQAVKPGVPAALHALPAGAKANRETLARWLVSPSNPLVGRVTVNRWWSEFFGRGIVESLEDFGTQGERPTHPKLLDWLAVEFVESGWSMKHIHKLIVMSATYQQSSRVTPELLQRDPYNKLYARGPRVRLSAETIRDNALTIAGLLSTKMAGPPVFPPQPPNIWRHIGRNAPKYATSTGEDRFRRGVYVVWRRSAPYPSFVNFDAPDRASCVVQRSRTNTPLQALTLMNDPAYVEMAKALAARILTEGTGTSVADRIDYGFRLCLSRSPKPAEAKFLESIYRTELARLTANPKAAQALADNSAAKPAANTKAPTGKTQVAELAAWFYIANILLNLDETITKG